MKIDWTKFLIFALIALLLEYLLFVSELDSYFDMVSDIQGHRYNFYKDVNGNFSLKSTLIFTVCYVAFALCIYFYVIHSKRSYLEVFLFGLFLALMWDVAIYAMFVKAENHIPVLLYDSYIVTAGGFTFAAYLFYNFYDTLLNHLPLLSSACIGSMGLLLYRAYLYSNRIQS